MPRGFGTRALHAGYSEDRAVRASIPPIYQTTAYNFGSSREAAELFSRTRKGYVYSRYENPTVGLFEIRMAALEQGSGAVAAASGLAAQFMTLLSLLGPGDRVVAARSMDRGALGQLDKTVRGAGIDVSYVDASDLDSWRRTRDSRTKAFYAETIGNPDLKVLDIEGVASIAHSAGILLVVNNTFASPYLCTPIKWGADVVIHSAGKFLSGHGTTLGGVVVARRRDRRRGDAVRTSPGATWEPTAWLSKLRLETLRYVGASLSPLNAFLLLVGLETLHLRMERQADNALAVAQFLKQHSHVAAVKYPGLENDQHDSVAKYLGGRGGAVLTFEVLGQAKAARRCVDALRLIATAGTVGDSRSLALHPASTTHAGLSAQELRAFGLSHATLRLSVGTEDVDDLIADLDSALTHKT